MAVCVEESEKCFLRSHETAETFLHATCGLDVVLWLLSRRHFHDMIFYLAWQNTDAIEVDLTNL